MLSFKKFLIEDSQEQLSPSLGKLTGGIPQNIDWEKEFQRKKEELTRYAKQNNLPIPTDSQIANDMRTQFLQINSEVEANAQQPLSNYNVSPPIPEYNFDLGLPHQNPNATNVFNKFIQSKQSENKDSTPTTMPAIGMPPDSSFKPSKTDLYRRFYNPETGALKLNDLKQAVSKDPSILQNAGLDVETFMNEKDMMNAEYMANQIWDTGNQGKIRIRRKDLHPESLKRDINSFSDDVLNDPESSLWSNFYTRSPEEYETADPWVNTERLLNKKTKLPSAKEIQEYKKTGKISGEYDQQTFDEALKTWEQLRHQIEFVNNKFRRSQSLAKTDTIDTPYVFARYSDALRYYPESQEISGSKEDQDRSRRVNSALRYYLKDMLSNYRVVGAKSEYQDPQMIQGSIRTDKYSTELAPAYKSGTLYPQRSDIEELMQRMEKEQERKTKAGLPEFEQIDSKQLNDLLSVLDQDQGGQEKKSIGRKYLLQKLLTKYYPRYKFSAD